MHHLLKHKTTLSCQFDVFQRKPHFIHDFSAIPAALKHWNSLYCCCFDVFPLEGVTFRLPVLQISINVKYRIIQGVCHWKTRLILLSYILKGILKKLAYQTDWLLVAVFGTFRSSNSSTLKLRSFYFGFHTSLFHQNVPFCSLPIRCIGC